MAVRPSTALVVLAVVVLAGCTINIGPGVQGSGVVITETREVSGFDEIVVFGSGEVIVTVTGTESLQIEAEDNIMPILTTDVVNGRLELGSSRSYTTTRGITYTITAAELTKVTIEGSGDVDATGIDTDSFSVQIDGSGNVVPVGTSTELDVEVNGSGDVDTTGLVAAVGTVEINGSGNATVNVTNQLAITINGSGNVTYLGSPVVDEQINGSGNVNRG